MDGWTMLLGSMLISNSIAQIIIHVIEQIGTSNVLQSSQTVHLFVKLQDWWLKVGTIIPSRPPYMPIA